MLPAFFVLIGMGFFGLPFWVAVLLGVAVSIVTLGLMFKKLMVDPMLHHGVLPLVIATIGLAILMKEAVREFYGADAWPFPPLAAATNVTVFGAALAVQSLLVLGISIAAVAALQLFLNKTRTGRCMQATAQNPTVARLLGVPVERMILYTFLINAALVALASLLITPIYLAKFTNGELLGLYAFIAAIIGGFNQIRGAIAGGLLLGVIDNFTAVYVSTQYRLVVPLLFLIVIILFRPQGLLGRRGAHRMRRRRSIAAGAALALSVGFLLIAPFLFKPYGIFILTTWAVMTVAAIGLNLTLGYAGQISLAQAAFVGIGAYLTAWLTTRGWSFWPTLGLAGVACFVTGWLLGYPALRLQHHYLAFVTLAFNTLVYLVFRNEEWLTGGIYGISNVPRPSLAGWSLNGAHAFYYFCLASLALVSLATWWLIRSPWGRAFVALRENPMRALSLGVDTRRYTLMAFALGAGLGGVSGALYAPLVQFIDPTPFALALSLNLLLMVVVGGSGYFFGPFLGAVVAVLLPEWLRFAQGYYLMGYAVLVMLLMVFSPSGLLGLADRLLSPTTRAAPAAAPEMAR
jgi:branched-chain amino acid transport system permease protein